jgi:hypothetical protein
MAPVHPGNGMLHWGDRFEIPNPTESPSSILAVPVTLLRGNGDLVIDRLGQAIRNRGTKTTRFRLSNLQERRLPDAPAGAEWTAWVVAEPN